MDNDKKIMVMKVHSKSANNWCIVTTPHGLFNVIETHFPEDVPLEDYNLEDVVTITFEEWTQAELDALPEMETLFD